TGYTGVALQWRAIGVCPHRQATRIGCQVTNKECYPPLLEHSMRLLFGDSRYYRWYPCCRVWNCHQVTKQLVYMRKLQASWCGRLLCLRSVARLVYSWQSLAEQMLEEW